jgi:iron complex outermembrane recepter protein
MALAPTGIFQAQPAGDRRAPQGKDIQFMSKVSLFGGGSALAVALSLALSGQALAQEDAAQVEEVVVTGSFIRGTPEDAALPVDVINAEELEKQGSPSVVEMVKALTVSNGVIGDTNQFDARAQGSEGAASINLRGLGASRTLVLFNGRRLVNAPIGVGSPDVNLLPMAAVGRVEILKDGAAATYGSDAIAGVVNFITRKNLDGIEVKADYRYIDGSDGDYGGSIAFGETFDWGNILLTAGWQHRSELDATERDWPFRGYYGLPESYSSGGNPSSFLPTGPVGANPFTILGGVTRDAGCAPLGGTPAFTGSIATPVCFWNYTAYDNLVEKEDRYQIFGEINADVTDTITAHVEGFYSHTDTPQWATSPSYLALQVPTQTTNPAVAAGLSAGYWVPITNPGFALYKSQNPSQFGGAAALANGAYFPGSLFRPLGLAGNPLFGDKASHGSREYEAWRFSASLTGKPSDKFGWDLGVTYMSDNLVRTGYDSVVSRLQLALRGLGGEGCNPATGTPGVGSCKWFNPFSNAIASNALTGQTNPGFNAAVANDPEVIRWFFQKGSSDLTSRLMVLDLVFNGETGIDLGGGPIAWAVGGQFRKGWFETKYDALSDLTVTPCIDTPVTGTTNCAVRNGPFLFLGGATPTDLQGDVWAGFGEVSLPFTDNFSVQLAARYEDYGKNGGSTFDPKLSARWQVNDLLAFRGSVSTTFRAPPLTQLDPGQVTTLQFLGGGFRAVDIVGNPNLEPESATTYSVGAILSAGNFRATVDYWSFDFDNPLVTEPVGGMFNTMFPAGVATTDPNHPCNAASFAGLKSRFTFQGACASTTISRIRTGVINGPANKTSGIDVLANYDIDDIWGGNASIGGSLTYVDEFKVAATTVEGVVVSQAFDGVNYLNYQTQIVPIPQWKAQVHFEYARGSHNVRLTLNYTDSYIDQRTANYPPNVLFNADGTTRMQPSDGRKLDGWLTADLTYRVFLPWETTAVVSVDNITDEDPPFARLDLGYDPFTHNPLGRTVKLNLTKKF